MSEKEVKFIEEKILNLESDNKILKDKIKKLENITKRMEIHLEDYYGDLR
jgi:hypothetical protein